MPKSLFDKIWAAHEVAPGLLYIDLHLVHEVTSPQAFDGLRLAGRPVRRPDRTLATADHNVPTDGTPVAARIKDALSRVQVETLERNCAEFGIPVYSLGSEHQGIVHVIGPELGVTQPGMTIVCGDSHTATHGAFGALAFGIGTSEVEHVLATQCLVQSKPKSMRIRYEGELGFGVTAKDLILATIGQIGVDGAVGHVVEYAGPAIESLSMEGRMTVCNMTIEGGGRAGMIAPDETTFEWVLGRPGRLPEVPDAWRELRTDAGRDVRPGDRRRRRRDQPDGDLGHDSRDGRAGHRGRARAGVRAGRAGARVHGPRAGVPIAGDQARPRVHRLVHELADRRPAGRRGGRRRPPGRLRRLRDGRSRLAAGEGAGRARGPGRGVPPGRLRLARGRLLDVPGHEPRHRRARRARRLHVEPQLRGPAGPRRPLAPRLARRWPPRRRSRGTSSTSASGRREHEGDRDDHRAGQRPEPRRRRHRPDHPQAVPQAGRADRLRRVPVLRLGQGAGLGPAQEPDPRRRAQLRLRLEPRARAVGARGLRLPGDHRPELRRHLPLQLHQDRAAARSS